MTMDANRSECKTEQISKTLDILPFEHFTFKTAVHGPDIMQWRRKDSGHFGGSLARMNSSLCTFVKSSGRRQLEQKEDQMPGHKRPAAEYVRMSTDTQEFSMENQNDLPPGK